MRDSVLLFAKNVLFTVLVPGTVAVFVPLLILSHAGYEVSVRSGAAALLLLLGASIYFWCLWDFAVTGRGTPAPIDPPKALVVRGLYKYTRNPMYVGVLSVIGAWAILFGALNMAIYGVCVAAGFHFFVLFYEEPHLRSVFGDSYRNYCAAVNRWLPVGKRPSA